MALTTSRTAPVRTTVNIGGKTMKAAHTLQAVLGLPNVSVAVRMGVATLDAINTAETMGYSVVMIDGAGRRFRYSLRQPLQMVAIDADGMATGKIITLVDTEGATNTSATKASKAKKPVRFKTITGGKARARI